MSVIGKPRDERGAVAPFVAVLIVLLVGLASFAVDLGYQRVAARDMQALADVVAMDMARQLDGRTGTVLKNQAAWKDAVSDSLARNDDDAVGDPLTVEPCGEDLGTLPDDEPWICATPGVYDPATGDFEVNNVDPATHARVVTRTKIDYFFPVYADEGWVTKTAYAQGGDGACIRISSYLADVDLNDGALGPLLNLLGTEVGLSAAQAASLVDTDISLLRLLEAEVDGVTLGEAADATVSLAGFLDVLGAEVLPQDETAALSVLNFLHGKVGSQQISLDQILSLATGSGQGLDAQVNLFDIVAPAIVAGNGENGVALDLPVTLPGGLAGFDVAAHVIQRPQIGCGRKSSSSNPEVEASQVGVTLTSSVLPPGNVLESILDFVTGDILGSLGCVLTLGQVCRDFMIDVTVGAKVDLRVAPAKAKMTGIDCLGDQRVVHVRVASGQILKLDLTVTAEIKVSQQRKKWTIGGWEPVGEPQAIGKIGGPITATTQPTGPQWEDHTITIDEDGDYDVPQTLGQATLGLPELPALDVSGFKTIPIGGSDLSEVVLQPILNLLVGPLGVVRGVYDTIKSGLVDGVVNQLLLALGVDAAGAKLSALRTPQCGVPALRG